MNRKQRRAAAKLRSPATQLLATAVRLHQAGQLVAAEACYRQVLAAQPNLAEGHFRLGDALMDQGKFDEAVAAYRRAIGFKSNYAEAHSNLGNALVEQARRGGCRISPGDRYQARLG
jgi:cytochrome c-type biogenesis protein CcmH/NrfG